MLFPTVSFAVFFLIAFTVSWLLRPAQRVWLWVMTAISFWFYGYADARFVWLLAFSIVSSWAFGAAIHRSLGPDGHRTAASTNLVRAAVIVDLALLGWFKYYGFFVDSVREALDSIGLGMSPPLLEIALPIGISFFTFHAISYVIDIGRGQLRPLRLDELALYMSFFPHLVAGPIVRASEFAPQLRVPADPRRIPSGEAFRLIAFGLFKKVVVSSYVATEIVDPVFGAPAAHGPLDLLIGVYAYAIQIYADFSGYTDIAIGCALLLGIRFPQNFDGPYRALSIQDFWRRWHMTLSRWLRDYLYIPLGGNRHGERQTYRNLVLTMVIGGLWHGAAITFLVWGALHGGYLAGERWVKERWAATHSEPVLPREITAVLQWVLTFHLVCFAWIFFRADSLGTAFDVIGGIVSGTQSNELVTGLLIATIVLMIASQFVPPRRVERAQVRFTLLGPGVQVACLAVALTVIDVLGPDGVAPFIYFRFRASSLAFGELLGALRCGLRPRSRSTRGMAKPPPRGWGAPAEPLPPTPPALPRRSRPGEQPAGRILLTMVVALGLAALVNADALVERAESKPLGPARDRSLMVWHPVQDIANVSQITRLRDLGDWLVGNEDKGGAGVTNEIDDAPAGAVRPTLRPPTADEPLRVYIGGDSIIRDAGDAFLDLASDSPLFDTTLHYENATGLTRPDFYDWPAAFADDMGSHRPEVAFVLFGGNDSQGIIGPDGEALSGPGDPRWREEYARRVAGVMDVLRADDRIVYWIGLPPMRDDGFDRRAEIMNEIYRTAAERRPWMTYLDTQPVFGDERGAYVERKKDASGDPVDLRQDDGVHLSQPGATQLARVMLDLIDEEIQAGRAAASETTETTADGS